MSWFEEWFDSPLYEKLYVNRDETEARRLVDLLENTLSLNSCSTILDLGCGRGRHAINLARKGYRVTGIDLSPQAIETANKKKNELDLENVHFEVRDMRTPLPTTFDAVVNLFTTFGYFSTDDENASVFDSVCQMLQPGGIFVLDYLNAPQVRETYRPTDEGTFQNIDYNIDRYLKEGAIFKDIHFERASDGAQKTYSERVKLYNIQWFEKEMDKRGLKIDHVYGDYQGAPYDAESSPRMLIVSHLEQEAKSEK